MSAQTADAVIVGGGVIGAAVAYELAKTGQRVCVIERDALASAASGANVGLVAPVNKIPGIRLRLLWEGALAYERLGEELDADIEYVRCGALYVFSTPEELEQGKAHFAAQREMGFPSEWISGEEVRRRESFFASPVLAGIYSHLDGHVNPFAVTLGYARAAQRLGARIIEGSAVTAIEAQAGRVEAVQHRGGRILTRTVVNAAGSWSPDIGEMVGIRVPVLPCRGQVLITPRIPRYRGHIIMGVEPSARQERAGGVIVGSTKQFVGFNDSVDYHTLTEFARGAVAHFPFLRGLSALRTWAGLRPASPDDMPILGPAGKPEGYFLATGHFRTGVATAPPTGRVMAEMILGRTPSLPIQECGFARFAHPVEWPEAGDAPTG